MKLTKSMKVKIAALAPVALMGLSVAPHAWADSVLLVQQTTMVNGNEWTSDSFNASRAGTVTVNLQDLNAFSALSALSFTANSATQALASVNATGMTDGTFSFNVGAGSYFANIMATAGGPMGLGLYSVTMNFTPNAVPLPSSGWLLLTGAFALLGVLRAVRPLDSMGTAAA